VKPSTHRQAGQQLDSSAQLLREIMGLMDVKDLKDVGAVDRWDLHPMIYRWFIHVDGWDLLVIYPGNWYFGEFPGNQWKYWLVVWNMNGL